MDCVSFDYSLGDRDAERSVLPLAIERHLAVLITAPLGGGDVIGKTLTPNLPNWAADIGVTGWPHFLLEYVISHPAVTARLVAPRRWRIWRPTCVPGVAGCPIR